MTNVKADQTGHPDSGFLGVTFTKTASADRFKSATEAELLAFLSAGTSTNHPAQLHLCASCTHQEHVLADVARSWALNEGKTCAQRSEPKPPKPISPWQERR